MSTDSADLTPYTPLDKIRVYLGGSQVNTTPRHLNFSADDFLATEDAINNRIDIALTKILQNNEAWRAKKADATLQDLIKLNASNNPVIGTKLGFIEPASARQYTWRDIAGVLVPFGSNGANVSLVGPASAQTYTHPNATGTLALTSDIPAAAENFLDWRDYQWAYHSVTRGDAGGGLWSDILWSEGTFGYIHSTTNYSRGKWTTAATDNTRAGWITEFDFTRGDLNPRADFKVQGSNTDVQRFFGFVGGTAGTVLDLDSALNTAHCFGLWISTAGTNVQVGRNDADGSLNAQDLTPTTTIASGGLQEVSIYTEDEGATWHLVFNGTDNSYTTDIPTANETLGFMGCVQVRGGVAAKNFEMRYCQFHHDMG